MVPKYAYKSNLSDKSNVYSFGVVVMEVVHNKVAQFVDPRLQSYDKDELMRTINIGIICTSRAYADMPPMLPKNLLSHCKNIFEAHMTVLSDECMS
ncbi:unnamed protein product [Arabidopsis halleri]